MRRIVCQEEQQVMCDSLTLLRQFSDPRTDNAFMATPGELTVRKSLQFAFKHFGVRVDVINSDAQFNACDLKRYDFVILDPWTWAAKGECRLVK